MCWGNAPYACRCIASEDHVSSHLWIVMPVYNEQESVGGVFAEWLPALRQLGISFTLLALNDGSIDDTLAILQRVARANSEVEVVDKPNSGHGPTCIVGYRHALAAGAEWVLQIDSDGQCDPRYLAEFWCASADAVVVFGLRVTRDDGWMRWWISRVVSLVCLITRGTWIPDANVPYRLMRRDVLLRALEWIPNDFYLANILLAIELRCLARFKWVRIHFRGRFGGTSSIRFRRLSRYGWQLFRQLSLPRRREQ